MDLDKTLKRLKSERFRNLGQIARATGLSHPTLIKIRYGQTVEPKYSTLLKLADYYDRTTN